MAAPSKWSLQNIAERFQRVLGAVGEVPIALGETLTPNALAADLTLPGASTTKGRRFSWYNPPQQNAASVGWWAQFRQDVIIDRFFFQSVSPTAGLRFYVALVNPGGTSPGALGFFNGFWTDRPSLGTGDPGPLETSAPAGAAVVATGLPALQIYGTAPVAGAPITIDKPVQWFVERNGWIQIVQTAGIGVGGFFTFGIEGRTA